MHILYITQNDKITFSNFASYQHPMFYIFDSACGLATFNNHKLYGLRPLVQHLFCAPASSAASERLFSQARPGLHDYRGQLEIGCPKIDCLNLFS